MENEIDIKNIINCASKLLEQHNVEHIPKTTFTKYICGYSVPKKLSYNQEKIQDKLKLIYWATASIHIELGNMLIANHSYNKFKELKDSNNTELSYLLFMHHYFLSIECIYRTWERISRVLYFIHTKTLKRSCYYHKTISTLKESQAFSDKLINELESHLPHWERISKARNKFSHEYSRLTHGIDFEVGKSKIVNTQGKYYFQINETRFLPESIFRSVVDQYIYLKKLDESLVKFIDNFNENN